MTANRLPTLPLKRRSLLKATGIAAAAAALPMPFIRPSYAARSLKVSTFGGYFEDSFKDHVYPEFAKASGITVESVSQPGSLQFLVQLAEANKAGIAPMDLCTSSQTNVLRGRNAKVWRSFDMTKIPNSSNILPIYMHDGPNGMDGVGAMAWFQTLIVNPKMVDPQPDSWSILWDASKGQRWGVTTGGNSTLFEVTAAVYFGGNDVLKTKEGIQQVLDKIAELKPAVKIWWDSEGTMQTAFENEEIAGGQYYHDVAGVMKANGTSVVSIFPKEGGIVDFGAWAQPSSSTKIEEAQEYINFISLPSTQALMSRKIGVAPVVAKTATGLSDEEFAKVSSEIQPIVTAVASRVEFEDFMDQGFTRALKS